MVVRNEHSHEIDVITQVIMKLDMDRKNKIVNYEDIGMADPFSTAKSLEVAEVTINDFNFFTYVYSEKVMNPIIKKIEENGFAKPPKCIFVPCREIIRSMIRALVKYGDKEDDRIFFLRFGLVDYNN